MLANSWFFIQFWRHIFVQKRLKRFDHTHLNHGRLNVRHKEWAWPIGANLHEEYFKPQKISEDKGLSSSSSINFPIICTNVRQLWASMPTMKLALKTKMNMVRIRKYKQMSYRLPIKLAGLLLQKRQGLESKLIWTFRMQVVLAHTFFIIVLIGIS